VSTALRRLRALRALLRVEQRELRLHPWRSLLVVLLVALPVAALVGGGTLLRITTPTPAEARARVLGQAALRVEAGAGLALGAARERLPAHARVTTLAQGEDELAAPGFRLGVRLLELDSAALGPDGLARGLVQIAEGHAPRDASEVALSPLLLAELALTPGERVTLADGQTTVTGVVLDPEDLEAPLMLLAPRPSPRPLPRAVPALLVDLPADEVPALAAELRAAGFRVRTAAELGARDGFESAALFVVGGFGFVEAALVVGAALAVGLRRRQRELGLLAACGAARGVLRTAVLLSTSALAGLGVLLGTALGVGAALALWPFLDGWNQRQNGAFEFSGAHFVGALGLALATALAAAALPVRGATRLSLRVALGGLRPVTSGSRAWLVAGLALTGGGAALVLFARAAEDARATIGILVGSALALAGLGALSPWLLAGLARRAAPLPLAWRLAVRDAGRFRTRNGPMVTAVLSGVALGVLLAALLAAVDGALGGLPRTLRDDQLLIQGPGAAEVARRVRADLNGVAHAPLAAAWAQGEPVRARAGAREAWLACGDAELLQALDLEPRASDAAGRLLWLAPEAEAEGELTLELFAGPRRLAAPAPERVTPSQRLRAPECVLDSAGMAALGLAPGPPPGASLTPWLVRLATPVSATDLRLARARAAGIAGTTVTADAGASVPGRGLLHALLALCALTGLSVVFVATALSAAESAADARVLHTLGAAPRVLRAHLAARAAYLALLGCALAVPAGLVPVLGLLPLADVPLAFVVPWPEVALTVLGLPALAFGGTWLFATLRRAPRALA
jgi:hypothetical protein